MPDTVPVALDLEPDVAVALAESATSERAHRALAEIVRSEAAAVSLVEAFRAFRRGHTLGGLNPKALIEEGRR